MDNWQASTVFFVRLQFHCLFVEQTYMIGRPVSMPNSAVHCKLPPAVHAARGHDSECGLKHLLPCLLG